MKFILPFLLAAATLVGQSLPPVTRFTVREGLAQQQVRGFLEDSRGYVWIATQGGLSRFDGRTLQSYGRDQGYRGNRVYRMMEAADGSIWYSSDEGVFRLDGIHESLLPDTPEFWEKQEPPYWDLILIPRLLHRRFPSVAGLGFQYRYIFDENGRPYVLDFKHNKLVLLEGKGATFDLPPSMIHVKLNHVSWGNTFLNDKFNFGKLLSDRNLQVMTQYQPESDTCLLLGPVGPKIVSIPFPYNSFWILEGDRYRRLPLASFINGRIDQIATDSKDRLYVATDAGFLFMPLNGLEFLQIPGLHYPWSVISAPGQPGQRYISDYRNGLFLIDTQGRVLERFPLPSLNPDLFQLFPGKCQGPDGTLLFGGYKGFFYLRDQRMQAFPMHETIECMAWDARIKGYLVAGSSLHVIDADLRKIVKTVLLPEEFTLGSNATDLSIGDNGDYWLTGTGGILHIDANGGVRHFRSGNKGLPPGKYHSLLRDSSGALWAGGYSGLLRYDGHAFHPVLPNLFKSPVNDLLALPGSRLAVITDRALALLDVRQPGQPLLEAWFDDSNGFKLMEPAENGAWWDGNSLWIPASNGLQRWSVASLQPLALRSARLRVDRVQGELTSLVSDTAQLTLQRRSARVRMSLVWTGPPAERYEYRSVGSDWVEAGVGPEIDLTNLRHGFNTVWIRAVLPGRPENAWPETKIVLPANLPLWDRSEMRTLAQVLIASVSLLLIWTAIRYIQEKSRRRRLAAHLNETRLQAVLAQLNPHMLFNLLTSLQNSIENRSKKQAGEHLVRIARLLREILELSMPPDAGSRYPFPVIPLEREVVFLRDYLELERMQQSQPFTFEIDTHGVTHPDRLCLPPLLIQPLLENAVLHGIRPAGRPCRIIVRFRTEGEWLDIQVEDDGIGRAAAQAAGKKGLFQYRSRGGALLRERLDLLTKLGYSSTLNLEDREGGGTIARLRVTRMATPTL